MTLALDSSDIKLLFTFWFQCGEYYYYQWWFLILMVKTQKMFYKHFYLQTLTTLNNIIWLLDTVDLLDNSHLEDWGSYLYFLVYSDGQNKKDDSVLKKSVVLLKDDYKACSFVMWIC